MNTDINIKENRSTGEIEVEAQNDKGTEFIENLFVCQKYYLNYAPTRAGLVISPNFLAALKACIEAEKLTFKVLET